jgi:hypothetical protein
LIASRGVGFVGGFRVALFSVSGLLVGFAVDFGPRIVYLGFESEDYNIMGFDPSIEVETPNGVWRLIGGHRLWAAPEVYPRTYTPDDKPVSIEASGGSIVVEGAPDYTNGLLKRIRVEPGSSMYSLRVIHEVVNIGRWTIEYSPWAITVLRPRGLAIIPLKPRRLDKQGLQADRVIALWPYTRLDDPRLKLTRDYILINQDPGVENPLKIGATANPPIAAYLVDNYLFTKRVECGPGKYPDHGVYVEVYTSRNYLELETLAQLKPVEPGEAHTHIEEWTLSKTTIPEPTIENLDKALKIA